MEMTAGLLCEVDEAFRRLGARSVKDDDPELHKTLAKLGHALHQVEDFFAHSNWAELASASMPGFLESAAPTDLGIELIDRSVSNFSLSGARDT